MTWLALPGAETHEPASSRRSVVERFFVQVQTMDPPNGTNWTAWFDTAAEAKHAADAVWRPDGRQEITDTRTGEQIVRGSTRDWSPPRVIRHG
jgi:hypothetical protein